MTLRTVSDLKDENSTTGRQKILACGWIFNHPGSKFGSSWLKIQPPSSITWLWRTQRGKGQKGWVDVVWIFSRVLWKFEFQAATSLATQSIMGQIFLRRNSMDFITFATRAQPVEVDIHSQQPPSQFNNSSLHPTKYTNISISGILQYEIRFWSCSIIFYEFSPKRKSNFFTSTNANDRQPLNLIFGHNNMFSSKEFSPVLSSSSQNQTLTTFQASPQHFRPSLPTKYGKFF